MRLGIIGQGVFSIVFSLLLFTFLSADTIKRVEKRIINEGEVYVYVTEKTPDYVIKAFLGKGYRPAFSLVGISQKKWIRKQITHFKGKTPYLILNGMPTPIERRHINEIARFLDFDLKILFIADKKSVKEFKSPVPVASVLKISVERSKKETAFYMHRGKMSEKAALLSAADQTDFKDSLFVNGAISFKKFSFLLINMNELKSDELLDNVNSAILFSDGEKNILKFIEKK